MWKGGVYSKIVNKILIRGESRMSSHLLCLPTAQILFIYTE